MLLGLVASAVGQQQFSPISLEDSQQHFQGRIQFESLLMCVSHHSTFPRSFTATESTAISAAATICTITTNSRSTGVSFPAATVSTAISSTAATVCLSAAAISSTTTAAVFFSAAVHNTAATAPKSAAVSATTAASHTGRSAANSSKTVQPHFVL